MPFLVTPQRHATAAAAAHHPAAATGPACVPAPSVPAPPHIYEGTVVANVLQMSNNWYAQATSLSTHPMNDTRKEGVVFHVSYGKFMDAETHTSRQFRR